MRLLRSSSFASVLVIATSIISCGRQPSVNTSAAPLELVNVVFITDEADTALGIIHAHRAGEPIPESRWSALFRTHGYVHLKEREAAMGRAFTDSSFQAFLTSDSLGARLPVLAPAVGALERIDVATAASLALAYLPAGTPLRARLYLEIKPITNTFVFTGADSVPSIFLYAQTSETTAQLQNTLAHELHHIGTEAACRSQQQGDSTTSSPAIGMLLDYISAFGEGRAMLAAAGGPEVHPHAEDPDSLRARWDRDLARVPADMQDLASFFSDVVQRRITSADSVKRRGNSYFGYQGPWYTVGWLMASTVERQFGRAALVGTLCRPADFLAQYNRAATSSNRSRHDQLPLWPKALIDSLSRIAGSRVAH